MYRIKISEMPLSVLLTFDFSLASHILNSVALRKKSSSDRVGTDSASKSTRFADRVGERERLRRRLELGSEVRRGEGDRDERAM
jgi:hypothetical protein